MQKWEVIVVMIWVPPKPLQVFFFFNIYSVEQIMALVLWWSCCYEPKQRLSHGISISTIIWGKQKTVSSSSRGRKANCESMSPAGVIKPRRGRVRIRRAPSTSFRVNEHMGGYTNTAGMAPSSVRCRDLCVWQHAALETAFSVGLGRHLSTLGTV